VMIRMSALSVASLRAAQGGTSRYVASTQPTDPSSKIQQGPARHAGGRSRPERARRGSRDGDTPIRFVGRNVCAAHLEHHEPAIDVTRRGRLRGYRERRAPRERLAGSEGLHPRNNFDVLAMVAEPAPRHAARAPRLIPPVMLLQGEPGPKHLRRNVNGKLELDLEYLASREGGRASRRQAQGAEAFAQRQGRPMGGPVVDRCGDADDREETAEQA